MSPGDGQVELLSLESLRPARPVLRDFRGRVAGLAFSPDGRLLAAVGHGAEPALWELATGEVRRLVGWRAADSDWVTFSADGRTLFTGGSDGANVWDVRTGRRLLHLDHGGYVPEAQPSPDGKLLATAGGRGEVIIWNLESGRKLATLEADDIFAFTARFSPDGKLLATGGRAGIVELWKVGTWKCVGRPMTGHAGFVLSASFDPSGRTLVTSSTDGKLRLWDVATQEQLGSGLTGADNYWSVSRFAPDGRRVVAVFETGRLLLWDVSPERWKEQACAVAGRNLTREEWSRFVTGHSYTTVCSKLPG